MQSKAPLIVCELLMSFVTRDIAIWILLIFWIEQRFYNQTHSYNSHPNNHVKRCEHFGKDEKLAAGA